ncbi:MAG: hypothetical protein WBZ36_14535, partial [Candidatus Nitrosopolaris sp.]
SWYRKQRQLPVNHSYQSESRAIADTTSSFRPETLLQPYPDAFLNSQTTMVQHKLEELRLLLGKFSSPQDAHKVLEWANITLSQGDESFLNNKLEQLRMLDRPGWRPI